MRRRQALLRRLLIGVLFAISNVVWWRIDKISSVNDISKHKNIQQYKVFEFHPVLALHNSSTAKLIPTTNPNEKHNAIVIWSTKTKVIEQLLPFAIESMFIRLQRNGKINIQQKLDTDQMKQHLHSFTQDELNEIDPEWQIFILESSDGGMGVWPYWYMQHEMTPLLGWNRLNYATRSTQNGRYMDMWSQKVKSNEMNPSLSFDEYSGKPINFTAMNVDGNATIIGNGCRSIQRLAMTVREPIVNAIDEYMKVKHASTYKEVADNSHGDIEQTRLHRSKAIAQLPRETDVRTFWNSTVCNMHCEFRNHISEIVDTIPQRHPKANITTNTEIVGFIHGQGRQQVHPDFIEAMMTTKIIVLAQRDRWEGHSRLYEMLLSGALVMSDPQMYWPHGIVDGENIVVYSSWTDLEQKTLYYLKNQRERIRIGIQGRELALTNHRSWQQAERLFLNDMTYRNDYGLSNKLWL